MRTALAILLVPTLAAAAPKFFTTVSTNDASVRDAVTKVKRKLDACWRATARITVRLTVDKGAVKAVELVEGDASGPIACLTKALRAIKVANRTRAAYELQLSSLNLDEIAAAGTLNTKLEVSKGGPSDGTAEINRFIRLHAAKFRACYQKQLVEKPKLAGKIAIKFSVGADGSVTKASVGSTSMNDKSVEDCLRDQVLRLKFPASVGPANITYPFLFSQGG